MLYGHHPRLIQGPFEDKFKNSEEINLSEEEQNDLGF